MIRSIIVDDEIKSCNVLKAMLSGYCPGVDVIATAHSIQEGKDAILQYRPDIVFLDIQMPTGNGFSLLMDFEKIDFKVIFITAYDEYAIKAIKFSALDYLLKPLNLDELIDSVEKYTRLKGPQQEQLKLDNLKHNLSDHKKPLAKIGLPSMEEIIFIDIDNIIRLEAESNYTRFYLEHTERIIVSHTLKNYEEMLSDHGFLRVHNSHIINLNKVKKYLRGKPGYAVMNDGTTIEISAKKKDEFMMRYGM